MRIAVVGTGYVGLTTAVALAFVGHEVYGIDRDLEKVALLANGKSPIYEPGLEELMALASTRLHFTGNTGAAVEHADVVFIAVGTPPLPNGEVDLSYVETASRETAESLRSGRSYTFVVKSTVPIGTNRRVASIVRQRLEERRVDARVYFASNPEFLREGLAVQDTLYPDRIVVGTEDEAAETLREVYRPLLDQTFEAPPFLPRPNGFARPAYLVTLPTSSEMIKYASNAFLATKISIANEVAGLCERVGADVTEVVRGMGLDARIGHRFLGAGVGWGGSCFPKDTLGLLALGQEHGYSMPIIAAAREVNERQRYSVIEKLQSALKSLRGRTIGVLGVAFKPNTDDVRESPALAIMRLLLERGAFVRVHDPIVTAETVGRLVSGAQFVAQPYHVAQGCDGLVLVTEWEEYRRLDLKELAGVMRTPVLVDGRNMYSREEAEALGFTYFGVGR